MKFERFKMKKGKKGDLKGLNLKLRNKNEENTGKNIDQDLMFENKENSICNNITKENM